MSDAAPLLAVSIGNSTTSLARYFLDGAQAGWPVPQHTIHIPTPELSAGDIGRLATEWNLSAADSAAHWLVASVHRAAEQRLAGWVRAERPGDAYLRLQRGDLPLEVDVPHPERVGMDRLVAAVAANLLRRPDRPAVVVDAGTAVTVDLVDAAGVFQGGLILPGLAMTARALCEGTDALPMVPIDPDAAPPEAVGKSTERAIASGLFWGTVGAVREGVLRMSENLAAPPDLIVTGGDARRMSPFLGGSARYIGDLVVGGVAVVSRSLR